MTPLAQQTATCNAAPMYLNILKRYANWNVCFLCGFDVEDGHTQKCVHGSCNVQITRRGMITQMQANALQWGTMHARRQCTKASCLVDCVGQSR